LICINRNPGDRLRCGWSEGPGAQLDSSSPSHRGV